MFCLHRCTITRLPAVSMWGRGAKWISVSSHGYGNEKIARHSYMIDCRRVWKITRRQCIIQTEGNYAHRGKTEKQPGE